MEATELVKRITAAVTAAIQPAGARLTWLELCERYEPEIEQLEAPATRRSEMKHVRRILGPEPVAGTDVQRVRGYRNTRRGEITIRRRPPSDKTINNEVILIRKLTKLAARRGWEALDPLGAAAEADLLAPVQNVRLNVVEDDARAPISLGALLRRASLLERAIVLVAHSSGMRRRELAQLEMSWIDRRHRLITIPPGIAKGRRGRKKGRVTIVSADALRALDTYRRQLGAARFCRWAFVNPRRLRPYSPDFFTRRFDRLQRRAGALGPSGDTWLHDLRRSFVTLAIRRGADSVRVMKLAGHSTLESQQRYNVESLEAAIRDRDRIEAARFREWRERRPAKRAPASKSASRLTR